MRLLILKPWSLSFAPASGVPVVLVAANKSPDPSSLIVAVPVTVRPPVLLACNLKVSPSSRSLSSVIATRTNRSAASPGLVSLSDGIMTRLPAVYGTQAVPFQYSNDGV